jgi:two-component system cell cycle sensor histidine kinase/response regulator CckA
MAAPLLEDARLTALVQSRIVDTQREREFDDLVRLAALVTESPMAMISFVDRDRLWLKAELGLNVEQLPRQHSFCDVAIAQAQPLSVPDAARDSRFAEYVLVASEPRVRSYAAAPLQDADNRLGTLAVLDVKPRMLSAEQLDALAALSRQVVSLLELRRLRDKRLLKTEALLASATRISRIGCWQWNVSTGEIHWSNEMYSMFGVPSSTVPDLDTFMSRVHPDDRALVEARTVLALEGGMTEFPDYRITRADGAVRTLQACAELERDAAGRPLLLTGALLDVTDARHSEEERKRLAVQVMHGQKLESLSVLSAGVAHDFNNLLVSILGNAELACADRELSANTRELIERTTESAIQAAALTRQLLAYTGRSHAAWVELDLSTHTESCTERARAAYPDSLLLSITLARRMPAIRADGDQLAQVTMNLIQNAAESYPDKVGEVRIRTYVAVLDGPQGHDLVAPGALLAGRYVVLEVADDGCGMTRETLDRALEPFFSTKFTGRGLGLSVVLGIARAHRAILTADSQPGRGSRFRLHFPALDCTASIPAVRPMDAPSTHALAGKTVLLVDDEARVRQLERRVLQDAGATVLEAENGDQAVALFEQHHKSIDLVLLDLVMPGRDSASTLGALRALEANVPVVIQSGYPEEEVTSRLQAVDGKLDFLQKPFSPKTLIAQLSQTLAAARARLR